MRAIRFSTILLPVAFALIVFLSHLPYLGLAYFWDELGQFVPASLDIYQLGAWIPKTTLPNVHPPAVMAYLALVWKIVGFSISATRIAMLFIAAAGVLFSFLLAIRLSRRTAGAPAFAAAIFLLASPLFYTQSMMAQLDMPAMTFTALALLLFLDGRIVVCVAACTVLVLVKETALSTPFVFAVWLWFRERRIREALSGAVSSRASETCGDRTNGAAGAVYRFRMPTVRGRRSSGGRAATGVSTQRSCSVGV